MDKNLGGRPQKYSEDLLLEKLEEYIEKNKNKKIKKSDLVKATGISRHIWDYSNKVSKIIDELNNPIQYISGIEDEIKVIASVESTVETALNTKKKQIEYVKLVNKVISDLSDEVERLSYLDKKFKEQEKKLKSANSKNKELEERLKKQVDAMLTLSLDSESLRKRNEKGLKDNIISIDIKKNFNKTVALNEKDIFAEFDILKD